VRIVKGQAVERWTFLVLAGPEGGASGLRITLRAGDDEAAWPQLQVTVDGTEVPVDDQPRDFEAPEWKAKEIMGKGGCTEVRWEALKEKLRAKVS